MVDYIPYGKQNISEADIQAVVEVLKSDWLTTGPLVGDFEDKLKSLCQADYCVAASNATAALHMAYLALGVGKGDQVWTSPNTFLSTANAAIMCGANVDFVDICPKTYNMSVVALEEKLIAAKKSNNLPKVVVPVHFGGQSCEMDKIAQLADVYGFRVVEDASHAVGGYYKNKPVGSCEFSDICIFSFHPVKIITTGEGGALLTNDKALYKKLALTRTHGMTRDPNQLQDTSQGDWYYEMISMGYNYRITDIQCALGISQLDRLRDFNQERHAIAKRYNENLKSENMTLPFQHKDSISAYHLYPVLVKKGKRKLIFDYLRKHKIGVNVLYIPVYLQPFYQKFGFEKSYCPDAENYYEQSISLPMYCGLTTKKQDFVIATLLKATEL